MAPHNAAAQTVADGIQKFRAAHLVVFLGRQPGDHEVAVLAGNEESIAVLCDKRGPFVCVPPVAVLSIDEFGRPPQSLAGGDADGSEDSDAVVGVPTARSSAIESPASLAPQSEIPQLATILTRIPQELGRAAALVACKAGNVWTTIRRIEESSVEVTEVVSHSHFSAPVIATDARHDDHDIRFGLQHRCEIVIGIRRRSFVQPLRIQEDSSGKSSK
jgi:hypothetical protein